MAVITSPIALASKRRSGRGVEADDQPHDAGADGDGKREAEQDIARRKPFDAARRILDRSREAGEMGAPGDEAHEDRELHDAGHRAEQGADHRRREARRRRPRTMVPKPRASDRDKERREQIERQRERGAADDAERRAARSRTTGAEGR